MRKSSKFIVISMLFAALMFVPFAKAVPGNNMVSASSEGVHVSTLFSPHPSNTGANRVEEVLVASTDNLPAYLSGSANKGALINISKNQRMVSNAFVISDNTKDDLLIRVRPAPDVNIYETSIKDNPAYKSDAGEAQKAGLFPSVRDIYIIVSDAEDASIYFEVAAEIRKGSGTANYTIANLKVKANNQNAWGAARGVETLSGSALIPASQWGNTEDFIPLYYDAAENKLYTPLNTSAGIPMVIRDFTDTYEGRGVPGGDNVWGGFPSGRATVDVRYANSVTRDANNDIITTSGDTSGMLFITHIDGLNLATDSSGNLLQANVDAYNAKATSFYGAPTSPEEISGVLGANSLPALKANSLLGNQTDASSLTEQYTVTVKDAEDNDVTEAMVTGLSGGKYTANAVFTPAEYGVYKVQYTLNQTTYSFNIKVQLIVDITLTSSVGGSVQGGGTLDGTNGVTIIATADEGYNFTGWFDGDDLVSDQAEYTFTPNGDMSLHAVFALNKYTVSFDSGEGSSVASITDVEHGSTITAPTSPKYVGKVFLGWFIDSEQTLKFNFETDTIKEGTVLYAKWGTVFMLTYKDEAEATIIQIEILEGTAAEAAQIPDVPQKTGYEGAWSVDASLAANITADLTIVPVYTVIKYSVTVQSAQGGSTAGGNEYDYGTEVTVTATADIGYSFVSWTENGQAVSTDAVYKFTPTKDTVLVATFEAQSFTITFDSNGGNALDSITAKYGATVTQPAAPQKEGYTFEGWFTDAALKNKYEFSTMPDSDLQLYASWQLKADTTYPAGTDKGCKSYTSAGALAVIAIALFAVIITTKSRKTAEK